MPAQQHLAGRTAVYVYDGGFSVFVVCAGGWFEKIRMDGDAIGCFEYDLPGGDEFCKGEVRGDFVCTEDGEGAAPV